jgi:hypothetical protein
MEWNKQYRNIYIRARRADPAATADVNGQLSHSNWQENKGS